MNRLDSRVFTALLRILGSQGEPLGATRLARELSLEGFELQPRMVRNYLREMDRRGWTRNLGRAGRRLTAGGEEELSRAGFADRLPLASARIDDAAFRMDVDLIRKTGRIIVNLSRVRVDYFREAGELFREFSRSPFGIPARLALALEGESLCGQTATYGFFLIGTVCNVTFNGALRGAGIPVSSRFAGLVEIAKGEPVRFAQMIHYEGCTLDPSLLLIKSRLTRVLPAVRTGEGMILAGFREIPAIARSEAERVAGLLERLGLGRPLAIGQPGRPVLGVPVPPGRVGIVMAAGLNLVAALEESEISTDHHAMSGLFPLEELLRPVEFERRLTTSRRLHQRIAALMDHPGPEEKEYLHSE